MPPSFKLVVASQSKQSGLVVAAHGRRGILETQDGQIIRYLVKGRHLRVVCGDRVTWAGQKYDRAAMVTNLLPRDNMLERMPPGRNDVEILAANLTCVVVVVAPIPKPDWFLIDRYLCAGELMGCRLLLVSNKNDLENQSPDNIKDTWRDTPEINTYISLGYRCLSVSARIAESLNDLRTELQNQIAILVGQSGVGKSSLINQLVPDAKITVGAISKATDEGTHTTTASTMHSLPHGGRLIDTPGVREFVPVIRDAQSVQSGFREILSLAGDCRFSNCQHLREPDCAVKKARDAGKISLRRYESYKRLWRTVENSG